MATDLGVLTLLANAATAAAWALSLRVYVTELANAEAIGLAVHDAHDQAIREARGARAISLECAARVRSEMAAAHTREATHPYAGYTRPAVDGAASTARLHFARWLVDRGRLTEWAADTAAVAARGAPDAGDAEHEAITAAEASRLLALLEGVV